MKTKYYEDSGSTSNKVKEQVEIYFREIEHITVTDEILYLI